MDNGGQFYKLSEWTSLWLCRATDHGSEKNQTQQSPKQSKATKKTAQPLGAVVLDGISCSKIGNRRVRVNAALGQKQKVSGRAAAGANHAAWLGSGSGVSECVDPGLMISRANQRLLVAFHHAERAKGMLSRSHFLLGGSDEKSGF
ncbi:hypothetical protein M431DRAFT_516063 [Trichoderma harzianum CBS 226.95]|jgi:hypothetical protein|uniref:Uncharacterized protein n=1 Tax=Trichoderma harzianum CBS 226.95 TaxID=983964 RepID=A0A2T4APA1_TRIHA|nr:hypothetical protein M431DRAFT_516063 [Trichoderma harzianum CBS 226.95]PTB58887.1 hypothetical protein M431DRAFT_516063 [Trichoderma harzianum CBS 226.95]